MVQVPMISIVDVTYEQTEEQDLQTVGLLGTKFTMTHDFFKTTFRDNGKNIVVPHQDEQEHIHKRIVDELENGIITQKTKDEFLKYISYLSLILVWELRKEIYNK